MLLPKPAVAPLTPVCVTVQLYVAPATPLLVLNAIPVVAPLQIVCDAGVATTSGLGSTVTITVIGEPAQLAAEGVIVYVAVPAIEPVVVNVSDIVEPLPTSTPLTPTSTRVQLYVGLATPLVVVNAMLVDTPLQIVCAAGVATTFGRGSTVIVTGIDTPAQPDALGVTR